METTGTGLSTVCSMQHEMWLLNFEKENFVFDCIFIDVVFVLHYFFFISLFLNGKITNLFALT
jgi:hypothetical protein